MQTSIRLSPTYRVSDPLILLTDEKSGFPTGLLSKEELNNLLQLIRQNYVVAPDAEITLEANPDDLSKEKLQTYFDKPSSFILLY